MLIILKNKQLYARCIIFNTEIRFPQETDLGNHSRRPASITQHIMAISASLIPYVVFFLSLWTGSRPRKGGFASSPAVVHFRKVSVSRKVGSSWKGGTVI